MEPTDLPQSLVLLSFPQTAEKFFSLLLLFSFETGHKQPSCLKFLGAKIMATSHHASTPSLGLVFRPLIPVSKTSQQRCLWWTLLSHLFFLSPLLIKSQFESYALPSSHVRNTNDKLSTFHRIISHEKIFAEDSGWSSL